MFVDPRGRVFAKHEGEFPLEPMRVALDGIIAGYDAEGMLDRRPLTLDPLPPGGGALRFPGKVLADAASDRLFIADSRAQPHRRGRPRWAGDDDDRRRRARLWRRGGRAKPGSITRRGWRSTRRVRRLFVADESNHAIRAIDLRDGQVTTVAGTGQHGYDRLGGGPGDEMSLSSPWDLALVGQRLWIAMAGTHQLWALDLATGRIGVAAGTGAESIHDGPLLQATFAQPSGLSASDGVIYVADSESSSIRSVDPGNDRVRRLVGRGLFDFGDIDGVAGQARLQHPLGVAATGKPGARRLRRRHLQRQAQAPRPDDPPEVTLVGRRRVLATRTAISRLPASGSRRAYRWPGPGSTWRTRTITRCGWSMWRRGRCGRWRSEGCDGSSGGSSRDTASQSSSESCLAEERSICEERRSPATTAGEASP